MFYFLWCTASRVASFFIPPSIKQILPIPWVLGRYNTLNIIYLQYDTLQHMLITFAWKHEDNAMSWQKTRTNKKLQKYIVILLINENSKLTIVFLRDFYFCFGNFYSSSSRFWNWSGTGAALEVRIHNINLNIHRLRCEVTRDWDLDC